jgi:LuxR family maltose regulon positive regulatory protein
VSRERVVARLAAARDVPLALLVAPAGYGKTAVLAEWSEADERPFAWVTLESADDDPVRLLSSIAAALDEVESVGLELLGARAAPVDVLGERLARSFAARRPFVLVLDDTHVVRAPAAFAAVEVLVDHLPAGSQLAIASRAQPAALPVGRLRAHRRLVELGPRDLEMSLDEAAAVLDGLDLRESDVDLLLQRTEGWPAGLYLAALSLRDEPDRARALARFAGDDRLVADYMRDELLAEQPRDRVSFLTRTSVLGDLSGPLCDAVLARPGSGRTLLELSRSNLMLVPLDRADDRYRYHGLFAEMLQAELRRREPEWEAELHRRASAWHAARGEVGRAVEHAIAADEVRGAGELVWRVAADEVMTGGHVRLRDWLARFTAAEIAAHPALALSAATSQLATGDRDMVEHWCAAAEHGLHAEDDPTDLAIVDLLRALVAPGGVGPMRAAATSAADRLADDVPWQALCCLLRGVADHLSGDATGGRAHLEEGARRAAVSAPVVQVLCLAALGILALDRDDVDSAELCIARARRQVDRVGLGDYPTCALVFAASALDRAQRGRVDDARRDLRDGIRLLDLLGDFAPWYEAETRVLLARAALRLGDVVAARSLLADAGRIARRTPDATVLAGWLEAAAERVESFSAATIVGPSALTTAELRVLRLLPTHFSFREIASKLHVSANTI